MIPFYLRESCQGALRIGSVFTELRRRRGQLIAGILGACLCLGACAAPSAAKLKAARQIVKEMNIKEGYELFQAECLKEGDKSDATELFEADPVPFSGLSPKSAYWPEVEGVFRRQQLRVCQAFTVQQYEEALARELAVRFPAKGLPSDPESAKQAMQEIMLEAFSAALESMQQSMYATGDRYDEMMGDELTAIVEQYRREPK